MHLTRLHKLIKEADKRSHIALQSSKDLGLKIRFDLGAFVTYTRYVRRLWNPITWASQADKIMTIAIAFLMLVGRRNGGAKLFFQSDSTSRLGFPIRPSSTLQQIDKIQLLTGVFRYLTSPEASHAKRV